VKEDRDTYVEKREKEE